MDSNSGIRPFLLTIILGYFSSKLLFNAVDLIPKKPVRYELGDFIATVILSLILYFILNLGARNIFSSESLWLFVGAFALGLLFPIFETGLEPIFGYSGIIAFLSLLGTLGIVVMLYVSFTASFRSVAMYGIYLITIVIIMSGIIFTTRDQQNVDITMTAGLISWIFALLLIYDGESGSGAISKFITFMTAVLIGSFVGNFSYNGVSYILSESPKKYDTTSACKLTVVKQLATLDSQFQVMKWMTLFNVLIILIIIFILYFTMK
jgi:hypothetical protein